MNYIEIPILIFFLAGVFIRIVPHEHKLPVKIISALVAVFSLVYGIFNFIDPCKESFSTIFCYTSFSGLIGLGASFFCFVIVIFSIRYADFVEFLNKYYAYIFISTGLALATVYSSNLLGLLIFWGLQGLTLYFLLNLLPGASNASKKAYAFIGGSDAIMILGLAIIWSLTGSLDIYKIKLNLGTSFPVMLAYLCLLVAALTKAGAMPFHTWVPDFAKHAPISLTAFFPASMDKLLGIFLIVLISKQLFVLSGAMSYFLLCIGAFTIIFAVSMAIVQHDLKELLSYHAVSQVGYMILGIATGTPLGIAAGVFHMVNHALYKSGLFLVASSIEYRTGKTNLELLGGLSQFMPFTFVVCIITSLSISGVPPLNGFASKWMIYLSLIDKLNSNGNIVAKYAFVFFLAAAMFGSALTLASFIKVIHSIFLGQPSEKYETARSKYKEVNPSMMFSMGLLAVLCIIFGLFPYSIALKGFVLPGLSSLGIRLDQIPGLWRPDLATAFVLFGIMLGLVIYFLGKFKFRKAEAFMGGEKLPLEARFQGTEFYNTISEMGWLKKIYLWAENKVFDIYHLGTNAALKSGSILTKFHMGSLQFYLLLFLIGFICVSMVFLSGRYF